MGNAYFGKTPGRRALPLTVVLRDSIIYMIKSSKVHGFLSSIGDSLSIDAIRSACKQYGTLTSEKYLENVLPYNVLVGNGFSMYESRFNNRKIKGNLSQIVGEVNVKYSEIPEISVTNEVGELIGIVDGAADVLSRFMELNRRLVSFTGYIKNKSIKPRIR